MKKNLSKSFRVYVILDRDLLSERKILKTARLALSAGADMLQLRDKSSSARAMLKTVKAIRKIAKRYRVPLIVNDRLDVALASGADGLHIGEGDIDISLAKKLLGEKRLIGASAKNLNQAMTAKRRGADYIGVGPVFKTPIKPRSKPKGLELFKKIKRLNIPYFAIGGIDCDNINNLARAGVKNVAVIRAVCEAKDPHKATKVLKRMLEKAT